MTAQKAVTGRKDFMKLLRFVCIVVLLALSLLARQPDWHKPSLPEPAATLSQPDAKTRARLNESFGKLPLSFEANQGQADSAVRFLSRGSGYQLSLKATEAVLELRNKKTDAARYSTRSGSDGAHHSAIVKMKLVNANPALQMAGRAELPGKSHYYIGNDPKNWRTNVASYAQVEYQQVWPGIDLVYYGNQRRLEYDFIIAPGAQPETISFTFDGADKVKLDAQGNLILHVADGEVVMQKPFVYQEVNGARREIAGSYQIQNQLVGFHIGEYDKNLPLVIDPVLVYSTYLGPASPDIANDIAVDQAGNVYITGGSFFSSEGLNVFVAKLNAAGTVLLYSTAFIGSKDEIGFGVAVDAAGNAYATGYTRSTNFPVKNAFQSKLGATDCRNVLGCSDAFVAKLDAAGTIVYSTYLGGNDRPGDQAAFGDEGKDIAVNSSGEAYVTGSAPSKNFPVKNAFQPTGNVDSRGEVFDGFITKFSASGTELVYSTYLGGTGTDSCHGIAVDAAGNAYVTGDTFGDQSNNFPTTQGAFQRTAPGGGRDAFVTKLNPTGNALVYSTFLGGSSSDQVEGIAVDSAGNAYIIGATTSTNFPLEGAHQTTTLGTTAFVTKLNPSGSGLLYSSYLGKQVWIRTGNSPGAAIAVDSAGIAYVTGATSATDFPLVNALFSIFGGVLDAYVAKINTVTKAVSYATLLGGSGRDEGHGIAIDSAGNAYVTGQTDSTNFPTKNPAQATPGGNGDVFVAKISDAAICPPAFAPEAAQAADTLSLDPTPKGGTEVSGALLKLGGLKVTASYRLESVEVAVLKVRLFDQEGIVRGDAGSITVNKLTACVPQNPSHEFVFPRESLNLTTSPGVAVTSLTLRAEMIDPRDSGIIRTAEVKYSVKPDDIFFVRDSQKINGQAAPDGSLLPADGKVNFDSELKYHMTNDLSGRIRLRAFNANGGAEIASKELGEVTATPDPTLWGTPLNLQFTVPDEVNQIAIVADLLAGNRSVLKTSPPLVYRRFNLRIELGTLFFGSAFVPYNQNDALQGGAELIPGQLSLRVKDDLPEALRQATPKALLTKKLNDGTIIQGQIPIPFVVRSGPPRPLLALSLARIVPDDADRLEIQLLLDPGQEGQAVLSDAQSVQVNRLRINTVNPPTDRKLLSGTSQRFEYLLGYNVRNYNGTIDVEYEYVLADGIKDIHRLNFDNGGKSAGASSKGEKFVFDLELPKNLFVLNAQFRLLLEDNPNNNTIIKSARKFYTKIEPPPVTIPAGVNQIFGALGVDGKTVENAVNRTVKQARSANDAKNAALEGVGLLKPNLLLPSEDETAAEATAEALTTASLFQDFVGLNATWQFDPPIPADGSFIADLKFYYSADDFPDDPNFNEATMRVIGFDPATGKLETYPTTVDVNAKTAAARVNGLMPMYSLGIFGPFAHRTLNFPVLRSLDDFTTQLYFTSFGNDSAGLSARLFTPTGQTDSGTGIVNPLTLTLPAGRTLSGRVSELFKLTAPLDGGWIQTQADKNFVAGYQMLGKDNRLDGLSLPVLAASTQVLTDVPYDATVTTEIHVANVTRFDTNLTLELRTAAGALAGSYETALAPKATFASRVQDIFTGLAQPFAGYVIVRGAQDLSAAALQLTAAEITALPGQIALPSNTATKLYAPYVLTGGTFFTTRLNLVNPTTSAANLTLKLVNENGANLAPPVNLQLTAGQQSERDVRQIFGLNLSNSVQGALIVESNLTGILGNVSYRDPSGQFMFRAQLPLESEAAKNFVFGYLDNRADAFTEVAVFNPQTQAAEVTLKVFKADGSAVGAATFNIPAGGLYEDLVDTIVGASGGQQGGYFTLSSNQPVVASAVFGALANTMIAALPGQAFDPTTFTRTATTVSAAHYKGPQLAAESIVSAFGTALASSVEVATTLPLPIQLAGTTIKVKDSAGTERLAPLFFVSAGQINYQVPPGTLTGTATVTVTSEAGTLATGTVQIEAVSPGLFTFTADGQGIPAAVVRRFRNNQELPSELAAELDAQNRWIARQIDLGPESDLVILEMFGTGLRFRTSLSGVSVKIGGVEGQIFYAGLAPGFVGLDQIDVAIPRSLIGRGEVDVVLTVDGKAANIVRVHIK
jgi:uncharacterized protein (TIGR03437 family)